MITSARCSPGAQSWGTLQNCQVNRSKLRAAVTLSSISPPTFWRLMLVGAIKLCLYSQRRLGLTYKIGTTFYNSLEYLCKSPKRRNKILMSYVVIANLSTKVFRRRDQPKNKVFPKNIEFKYILWTGAHWAPPK